MSKNNEKESQKVFFSAINPYEVVNTVEPIEKDSKRGFITWGENNDYPQYLKILFNSVATLHSIIEGTNDYINGDGVVVDDSFWSLKVNDKDETLNDIVRNIGRDLLLFGGFAINVLRDKIGNVRSLYYVPFERLRSDERNSTLFYSKDWTKSVGRVKYTSYPKFDPNKPAASSIFYFVNDKSNTYPTPSWNAAIKAAEIEKNVNDYHLNSICNGFAASYLISLNNGQPNEQMADEIEMNMKEKFAGAKNGGSLVINFAEDKDHSAELTKLETEDAGEKYKSLIERTKQELFTSFRALPQLFGINLNTGFSTQEYNEAFALYNRTVVYPRQQIIAKSLNYILGKEVCIIPFKLINEE